jgi:MFS family permease
MRSRDLLGRRHRDFTLLWLGQSVSLFGSRMYGAASLLWVFSVTHSATLAAATTTATLIAYTATHLFGGALADFGDRRTIMVVCNAVSALASATLALAAITGRFSAAHVVVVAAVLGVGWALHGTCESACVKQLVPADAFPRAITLNQVRSWTTGLLGPAAAGVLYGITSAAGFAPFALDAASYAVALLCVLGIRTELRVQGPHRPRLTASELGAGVRAIAHIPFLRSTTIQAAVSAGVTTMIGLVVVDGLTRTGTSSSVSGLVLTAASVGGCLGALAATLRTPRTPRLVMPLTHAATALSALALAVAPSVMTVAVAYGAMFLMRPAWAGAVEARWLALAPDHLQGRVRAGTELVLSLAMAAASLATASLLQLLGPTGLYVAIGAMMLVLVVVALRTPDRSDTSGGDGERVDAARAAGAAH